MSAALRRRGPAYDHDRLRELLGIDPPAAERQHAPAVWVGHRLHNEATAWLEHRQDTVRNRATVQTNGERLVAWITFLHGRGQTIHTATETDYRAYERRCRYPDVHDHPDLTPVSANWWSTTKSAIKQFHEWLLEVHGTPTPFRVVEKPAPGGGTSRGIPDAGRLRNERPDVVPLTPDALDAVLAASCRPTATGRPRAQQQRDHALVQWLAATGQRVGAATHMTTQGEVQRTVAPSSAFVARMMRDGDCKTSRRRGGSCGPRRRLVLVSRLVRLPGAPEAPPSQLSGNADRATDQDRRHEDGQAQRDVLGSGHQQPEDRDQGSGRDSVNRQIGD